MRHLPAAGLVGYLAGTLPSADLATRLARRGIADLRQHGSGNPGAVNAAALLGRRWGLTVLAADITKGTAAGFAGRLIAGPRGAYLAATAAIGGHIWPVWSRARGGKGVATSAGACLAVFPAYFPIDTAVAVAAGVAHRKAERTIWWSCAAWVGASVLWWRKQLPNAWGPRPSAGLPVFAVASSAMILAKFRVAERSR